MRYHIFAVINPHFHTFLPYLLKFPTVLFVKCMTYVLDLNFMVQYLLKKKDQLRIVTTKNQLQAFLIKCRSNLISKMNEWKLMNNYINLWF